MIDDKFYPSLSTLLPLGSIPPNLGFFQSALQDVFDNLFFRNLQVQKSKLGEVGFYQLSLVIYKRLGVEIPGTGGAALVLNPSQVDGQITEIPIALSYRWEILKYVRGFDHTSLTELPRLLFDAFVEISGVSLAELLGELIDDFHGTSTNPIQEFIDTYNLDNVPVVLLTKLNDPDPAAVMEDLIKQLDEVQQVNIYELAFAEYLNLGKTLEDTFEDITAFFGKWVKPLTLDDFQAFLIPKCAVAINNIDLALEFPRTLLQPVDTKGDVIDASSTLPEDKKLKSRLTFTAGSLLYSTETGFEFDSLSEFKFTTSQIGNTGIIVGFKEMKLDLSRTKNIPEATADRRPTDFVGVYVKEAEIDLPNKWFKQPDLDKPPASTVKIIGTNLIIGTGGFSGKIGFDAAGLFHTYLGNFAAELSAFDLRFERNSIVESNIVGALTIPGFKNATGNDATGNVAKIDVKAHIAEDGDFSVTASVKSGILVRIPNVLDFNIFSLGFGREDDRFFLSTSGTVTLTLKIPALTFDRPIAVDVKKLIIWEDGNIEIVGGTIILPQALTLKIGPVKISVTAISMGSYERNGNKYKYFGFDGGVNVNPGGVDVRASGVKVYWRTDAPTVNDLDIFVRVEGIAIDIVIPGSKSAEDATVLINGFLQMKEPDPNAAGSTSGTEYAGGVTFKMPKAGIGGSAAMRLNPSIPAFIIDTELSISVPIPLGSTSLGIYGFRGLIGMRYVVDRHHIGLAEDAEWYEYYKKKVPLSNKEGVNIDKFAPRKGFTIGAGLTLGTLTDSGKAFSAKLFLLLSLPDALLLQGQAAILSERVDLSPNDPPFFVFIAITKLSVEAAFGVNYKLPEGTGEILDLQALIEMGFYFNDSSAWYINAGRDQPVSKRISARLFTLFNAWSYLMLSAKGIKAGAGVSWDFNKRYGPIQVEAHAYLDTHGQISFKPKQIGAAILLGGSAAVRIFKFKLGLSIAAGLAAEAPKPFIVTGSVKVHVDLPRPFRKLGGTFTLEFTWNFDSSPNTAPEPLFNEAKLNEVAKMVNLATRERFDVNVPSGTAFANNALPPAPDSGWTGSFDNYVIPLDCTADIEFKKPIAPGPGVTNIGITGTGYNNVELVPPQRGVSPQVQHRYVVEEVKIRSWNPTTSKWDDYDIYGALTPLQHASFLKPSDLIGLKQGWWQTDSPGKVNKLSVLSQTPFSYVKDVAGPFIPENSGITTETIFCTEKPIQEKCLVVDEAQELNTLTADRRYAFKSLQIRVIGNDGGVVPFLNPFGLTKGIALKPDSRMEIFFPESTARVTLRLASLADNVTILYQKRRQAGTDNGGKPVYNYVTVKQGLLNAASLLRPVKYDVIGAPIDKVVILAGQCNCRDGVPTITTAMSVAQPPLTQSLSAASSNVAISVDRSSLLFSGQAGSNDPAAQTLVVSGTSSKVPVSFIVSANTSAGSNWLSATPERGTTPGTISVITHEVGLGSGIYHGLITITPIGTPEGVPSIKVGVTLTIAGAIPLTPKCGSLTAYLLKVCGEAQRQLDALQHRYDQLITQAKDYEDLSKQFEDNKCDPTLTPRFRQTEKEREEEAEALRPEILNLGTLIACCRRLGTVKLPVSSMMLTIGFGQPPQAFDCNIDPKADYSCMSLVFGICWLPLRDQIFNSTIPSFSSLLSNNNAMVTAINKTIHPIWRPETIYVISIRTKDNVNVDVPEMGDVATPTKYLHIGFRTRGPVGHFHKYRDEYSKLQAKDRADQYRLQSLKPYIDFSTSYPNADGNVLNAKPLFYVNPKLRLFYIHPYIYTMYGGQFDGYNGSPVTTSLIDVSILDPINPLPATAADPGHVAPVSLNFAANKLGRSDLDVRILNNMVKQGKPCTGSGQASGIAPMGIQSNVTVERLKPLKLYLAVFKANYKVEPAIGVKEEVHRYNFQTSRYADFTEQVNSYRLKDLNGAFLKNAIYDDITVTLDVTRSEQLTALLANNYPSGDPLEQEYADPFDRLLDGILRVGPIDPPVGTDFTIVRNAVNHQVIGILVRNPEPFNDPKVSPIEIEKTIVLSQRIFPPKQFRTLYSKDRSKAFLSETSLNMDLRDLDFTFIYLEYDGSAYLAASVVKASFFPSVSTGDTVDTGTLLGTEASL